MARARKLGGYLPGLAGLASLCLACGRDPASAPAPACEEAPASHTADVAWLRAEYYGDSLVALRSQLPFNIDVTVYRGNLQVNTYALQITQVAVPPDSDGDSTTYPPSYFAWNPVDSAGAALRPGCYTVEGDITALPGTDELSAYPDAVEAARTYRFRFTVPYPERP